MMGDIFDHLAEHMLFLSTAISFWYSLNSSYDNGFHLSERLGMTPKDYERQRWQLRWRWQWRGGGDGVGEGGGCGCGSGSRGEDGGG
jgi:hypothetical protein